jgi:membrane protease YdiL (CAAX protease family)
MSLTPKEPSGLPKSWQGSAWAQLLTAALCVVYYSSLIFLHLRRDQPLSIGGFILYGAVIAPLSILIALMLLRYLCGENPRDLNLRPGKLSSDLLAALVLSIVTIAASVISDFFLPWLLPESSPNTSTINLFEGLAGNPELLVLFVGVLFVLGAASEEVVRVFLLSRLWKVWPSNGGRLLAVAISACLFGFSHIFQGSASATGAGIYGLIMALYYLRFGRVVPLILSHYLTNALGLVVFAVLAR